MPVIKTPKADLKAKYSIYLKIAVIITLLLLNAAFKFFPHFSKNQIIKDKPQDVIKIEEVIHTIQKHQKPDLPKRPTIPENNDEEEPEDLLLDDISINYDEELNPPPDLVNRDEVYKDEPFIEFAETMPVPIGGLEGIAKRVIYTELAKRMDLEGKVVVEAWVDKHGYVKKAFVIKDIGGGLGEEVVGAILETKFIPGKQGNTPVSVKVRIPILFKLR